MLRYDQSFLIGGTSGLLLIARHRVRLSIFKVGLAHFMQARCMLRENFLHFAEEIIILLNVSLPSLTIKLPRRC